MATADEFAVASWKEGISDGNHSQPAGKWLTDGANEAYLAHHDGPRLGWEFGLSDGNHEQSAGKWLVDGANQAYLAHTELTEAVAELKTMVQDLINLVAPPA